ncbi:type II CAAX endopeptidase family protein [Paenibacillus sp. MER 99-2]|uniref:CPBP family intramembrane glutamic endopeptidase n=1 Tax=Paenibacillus sp. MER 99-2 TaxID=2939572 RepID=UPI002041634B|nr:type II CAAX endopeptidase family protein [Paenibacillus sp. MER 99-2]MCM3173718.1 CPBP family intramembrane metalloprotease [Paenibacillus sp. MER 99-2]
MQLDRSYSLKEVVKQLGLILLLPAIFFIITSLILEMLGVKNVDTTFVFILFQIIAYTWFLALNPRFREYIRDPLCSKVKIRTAAFYIIAGFVLLALTSVLILGTGIETNEGQRHLFESSDLRSAVTLQNIFVILAISIIIPFFEELLFRGLLFTTISNKYGAWWALIISSVVFGMLHGGVFIATSIFGLVFAYIFYKTKSLIPGILLHMIWNSLSVFLT